MPVWHSGTEGKGLLSDTDLAVPLCDIGILEDAPGFIIEPPRGGDLRLAGPPAQPGRGPGAGASAGHCRARAGIHGRRFKWPGLGFWAHEVGLWQGGRAVRPRPCARVGARI